MDRGNTEGRSETIEESMLGYGFGGRVKGLYAHENRRAEDPRDIHQEIQGPAKDIRPRSGAGEDNQSWNRLNGRSNGVDLWFEIPITPDGSIDEHVEQALAPLTGQVIDYFREWPVPILAGVEREYDSYCTRW